MRQALFSALVDLDGTLDLGILADTAVRWALGILLGEVFGNRCLPQRSNVFFHDLRQFRRGMLRLLNLCHSHALLVDRWDKAIFDKLTDRNRLGFSQGVGIIIADVELKSRLFGDAMVVLLLDCDRAREALPYAGARPAWLVLLLT